MKQLSWSSLRYRLRTKMAKNTFPYLAMKRREHYARIANTGKDPSIDGICWAPIDSKTDIVIEGFPRSANTYAVVAFRFAQIRQYRVAYRLHAPIQLITACRRGVPAIALIRNPKDAVLSWAIHRRDVTVMDALIGYEAFYSALLPYQSKLVVADFDDVTNHYDIIIQRANKKFGTNFQEFEQSEVNVKACFSIIDQYYSDSLGGTIPENVVARPSQERRELKKAFESEYHRPDIRERRNRAEEIYAILTR